MTFVLYLSTWSNNFFHEVVHDYIATSPHYQSSYFSGSKSKLSGRKSLLIAGIVSIIQPFTGIVPFIGNFFTVVNRMTTKHITVHLEFSILFLASTIVVSFYHMKEKKRTKHKTIASNALLAVVYGCLNWYTCKVCLKMLKLVLAGSLMRNNRLSLPHIKIQYTYKWYNLYFRIFHTTFSIVIISSKASNPGNVEGKFWIRDFYWRFSGLWRRSYRSGASAVHAPSRSMRKSWKNAISSRIFGISLNNFWVICGIFGHISPKSYLRKFRKFAKKSRFFNFSPYFEMGRGQHFMPSDRSDAIHS